MKKIFLLTLATLLFACQNAQIEYNYPENPENVRKQRAGKFFDDITLFDDKKTNQNNTKIVNQDSKNQLWISSLEVVGGILPIALADEKSGLIVSEWYQNAKNPNQRIKVNLLVQGSQPIAENLSLTIFSQNKDNQGQWIQKQLDSNGASSQMIKSKIISKTQSKIYQY